MAEPDTNADSIDIPPQPEPPAGTIGGVLTQTRKRIGYTLRDVAEMLRIRQSFLESIEGDRFHELPGMVYAVGFVRTYAEFLELDGEDAVRRFKEEVAGQARKTELAFPEPPPERRVAGGAVLLVAVLLAGVAYGGWYWMSSTDTQIADLVPALPDRFASLIDQDDAGAAPAGLDPLPPLDLDALGLEPEPVASPPPVSSPTRALAAMAPMEPPGGPPAADLSAEPGLIDRDAAVIAPVRDLAALAPGQAALAPNGLPLPPRPPGQDEAEAEGAPPPDGPRVVLRATALTWIQVKRADGTALMSRTLAAGETWPVPDTAGLVLDTGNAGGLEIVLDGRALDPIGGAGQVVRRIPLDVEALAAGARD